MMESLNLMENKTFTAYSAKMARLFNSETITTTVSVWMATLKSGRDVYLVLTSVRLAPMESLPNALYASMERIDCRTLPYADALTATTTMANKLTVRNVHTNAKPVMAKLIIVLSVMVSID